MTECSAFYANDVLANCPEFVTDGVELGQSKNNEILRVTERTDAWLTLLI